MSKILTHIATHIKILIVSAKIRCIRIRLDTSGVFQVLFYREFKLLNDTNILNLILSSLSFLIFKNTLFTD